MIHRPNHIYIYIYIYIQIIEIHVCLLKYFSYVSLMFNGTYQRVLNTSIIAPGGFEVPEPLTRGRASPGAAHAAF